MMPHKRFEVSSMHHAIKRILLLFGVQDLQSFEYQSDTFHSSLLINRLDFGSLNRRQRSRLARRSPIGFFTVNERRKKGPRRRAAHRINALTSMSPKHKSTKSATCCSIWGVDMRPYLGLASGRAQSKPFVKSSTVGMAT